MLNSILVALAAASLGMSTSGFCAEPRLGPGGSPLKYCEAVSDRSVSTPFFSMNVPAGVWFAISDKGRRGDVMPDLSMSMLMLTVTVLTPAESIEHRSKPLGTCAVNTSKTEWLCENQISGDTTLERLLIGKDYMLRVFLVERWSGPLVETYRSVLASVDFAE